MRQLNSKHFDTIEGASAHQGEIVSSQFAPSVSKKDEIMYIETFKKGSLEIDLKTRTQIESNRLIATMSKNGWHWLGTKRG